MTVAPADPPRRLAVGYYVENFEIVLRTVGDRYGDLLRPREAAFARDFAALSRDAKRLYVRLVARKGPYFRCDLLRYPEVASLERALDELAEGGLVAAAPDDDPLPLLRLFRRPELCAMAAELDAGELPGGARKPEVMAALAERTRPATLRAAIARRCAIVELPHAEDVVRFRLLFFGNLSQGWKEFVLRDLGMVRYERYALRRELRLYPTREALEDDLRARRCRELVAALLDAGRDDLALALARELRAESRHPAARRIADQVLNQLGRELERRGELAAALELYRRAHAPPARERETRILARRGRIAEALRLCERIARRPRDESEVVFARRFDHRLRRQRGEPLPPRRRRRRPVETLALARRDGASVETLALETLAAAGRRGFFAENWLWKSLFGLAFWDVIFAPVAGAFQHPFQSGPLDLYTPDFRPRRAAAIARRLDELRADPAPGPRLLRIYEAKRGLACSLVAWHEGLRPHLELALERLAGEHLAAVFDRLSRDLRRYRRGFPDLFALRDEPPGFELLEVKAPGDQLRPEQTGWIDAMNDAGIPATVLQVGWRAAPD